MEDFTTLCKNMPKKQNNFSRSLPTFTSKKKTRWISKNIFWNLVFWFGMSAGFAFAFSISGIDSPSGEFSLWSSLVLWLTIIGVPLLVTLANRTRFIKKDTFVNNENIALTKKQLPTGNFIFATILGFGFTFLVAETILSKDSFKLLNSMIFFVCLFSGFSLYFIFKNCPISILFNRKFWKFEPTSYSENTNSEGMRTTVIPNPIYGCKPANTFNHHRR